MCFHCRGELHHSVMQAYLHTRDSLSGRSYSPATPVMAVIALEHLPRKSSLDRSSSDGPPYFNSAIVFIDDVPSPGVDTMEETTHVADTFYSQAGQHDLVDTDVFPRVSASTAPWSSKNGLFHSLSPSPLCLTCRVLRSMQDPVPLRGGWIHLTGTPNGGEGLMTNCHCRNTG
jgi:hypothetical protein